MHTPVAIETTPNYACFKVLCVTRALSNAMEGPELVQPLLHDA